VKPSVTSVSHDSFATDIECRLRSKGRSVAPFRCVVVHAHHPRFDIRRKAEPKKSPVSNPVASPSRKCEHCNVSVRLIRRCVRCSLVAVSLVRRGFNALSRLGVTFVSIACFLSIICRRRTPGPRYRVTSTASLICPFALSRSRIEQRTARQLAPQFQRFLQPVGDFAKFRGVRVAKRSALTGGQSGDCPGIS